MSELPTGYKARAPRRGEIEAVTTLIRECEEADENGAEMTVDDVRAQWSRMRFDLRSDARVVVGSKGRLAGYVDVWDRTPGLRFLADGYVLPELRGHGIGTHLARAAESRAREKATEPGATVSHTIFYGDEAAHRLLIAEGYVVAQHYWRMAIHLPAAPSLPRLPDGVRIRAFLPGQDDRATWTLVQQAFSDNQDYTPLPLDEWSSFMLDRESFDPALYFLAESGSDEIVGAALCPQYQEHGWVRQLAVRRDWRGRGLGRALMEVVFVEFYARGQRKVALVVDSYNRTGARQFYESLGMTVERQHDRYEKNLEPRN